MSDLSISEKRKLEKLFSMASGYVLNFSDRTFGEFVEECTGKDIMDESYTIYGTSKAKRLRAFWDTEENYFVGKLIEGLLEFMEEGTLSNDDEKLLGLCKGITARLLDGAVVPDVDVLTANIDEKTFERLAKSIKEYIDKNQPEMGIDRLHTFMVKFLRALCEKHNIEFQKKDEPLHSLMGKYIKELKKIGMIESDMAERILKSNIAIMESFNDVRNNKSLAHDNHILSYPESILIFTQITSIIKFIKSIEGDEEVESSLQSDAESEDVIPF